MRKLTPEGSKASRRTLNASQLEPTSRPKGTTGSEKGAKKLPKGSPESESGGGSRLRRKSRSEIGVTCAAGMGIAVGVQLVFEGTVVLEALGGGSGGRQEGNFSRAVLPLARHLASAAPHS